LGILTSARERREITMYHQIGLPSTTGQALP
jgi:hypothetical protein